MIFRAKSDLFWRRSHAALPTPVRLSGDLCRVYFSSRDEFNRSHVGFFDIDLNDPTEVLRVSEVPVLTPGPLGHFDDHGIYAASAVLKDNRIYLYTIGWNPGPRPPLFYASIGLAISNDGGESFEKYGLSPIMTRSDHDPCLVTSPIVLNENDTWRMWYVSGYKWEEIEGVPQSYYHIKYAESDDGIHWRREGRICIDHASPEERNIARCCVVPDGQRYCAWYSFNADAGYRIGYAESEDGLTWRRRDDLSGIVPSHEGWDSRAQAYPYVVRHNGQLLMFYNGNEFGRDGIGLAIAGT